MVLILSSCKDYWNQHEGNGQVNSGKTLFDLINEDPRLTLFASYIKVTKLDTLLKQSKKFTVWAPNDKALYSMDTSIVMDGVIKDTVALRKIIANHICYDAYPSILSKDTIFIKMISGKHYDITRNQVYFGEKDNNVKIILSDQNASNGVMHLVDQIIIPTKSIWETLRAIDEVPALNAYLTKLDKQLYFDRASSRIIGIDPRTNKNVYDSVKFNKFLFDVAPIENEDSVYTFFAITDNVYQAEYMKYINYTEGSTKVINDSLNNIVVFKDLVVRGRYKKENLPDTLVSAIDGVRFHVSASSVVKSYTCSNGRMLVINDMGLPLRNKLKPVIVEVENFMGYLGSVVSGDPTAQISNNPYASGGKYVYWPIVANRGYGLVYQVDNSSRVKLFSTNYSILVSVVNDPSPKFSVGTNMLMRCLVGSRTISLRDFRYATINTSAAIVWNPSNTSYFQELPFSNPFNSTFIPQIFSLSKVDLTALTMILSQPNLSSASLLECDYIKLVPYIQ